MSNELLVSVLVITYNHSEYLAQALDSILAQETNFKIEVVIGEDCSSDNTRDICKRYKDKYPDIVKLLLNDTNLGMTSNFLNTLKNCKGKYVAICEGDDYWTDPYKLQKQVDFLEANEDCSMCFHRATIIDQRKEIDEYREQALYDKEQIELDLWKILTSYGIPTASIVFRNIFREREIPSLMSQVASGDMALVSILNRYGKIIGLNENMSVYRLSGKGVSVSHKEFEIIEQRLKLYRLLNQYYGDDYTEIFNKAKMYIINKHLPKNYHQYLTSFKRKTLFKILLKGIFNL